MQKNTNALETKEFSGAFVFLAKINDCKIVDFRLFSRRKSARFSPSARPFMIVGTEWIVDAAGCDAAKLRDAVVLQQIFDLIVADLKLKVVGNVHWHQFPAPGEGITGLALLTESHLACHTYPEYGSATFNLYCCNARPEWSWAENLRALLGAENVTVNKIVRRVAAAAEAKMVVGGDGR
jgi:S-adenosylmethionine decarboxylase